jgi:hypothetical protein
MSTTPLSLADIVNITVTVAPSAVSANSFNQGLFIGNSAVIPSYGANSRVQQFAASTFSTAMLTAGFTLTSPEYIAATIYFSQNPQPSFIWIGRQDLTAIETITLGTPGTGWATGDQFTIVAQTSGVPSSVAISSTSQGTGYSVASGLTTTAVSPSVGTGLTVNITVLGETLTQSAQYCRTASNLWYGLSVYNPADSDNLALSAWADPLWQSTRYYPWSADVAIANNAANNLAAQISTLKYRVQGIYSTTQSGLFPNNIYSAAALMGLEMGSNTGLANSFFSPMHKQLAGIAVEPITETQFTNIKTLNWNVYGNFGNAFQFYEPGQLSSGDPSWLWLYLAMLVANLQINELNVLASLPAVPQTNAGQQLLINAANQACALLASIGFLSGGVWTGLTLPVPSASNPAVTNGQALPLGYICVSPPYAQQSAANKAAGQAMPIYVLITPSGAVRSLSIAVYTTI